jgi:rod shape-determining protein MreC
VAVYRRTSRRRSVLILLVLTSITLITVDARGNNGGVTRTVRDAARDAMAPVQEAVDDILSPVADWFDGVTQSADLKDENRVLREQLAEARGEAARSRGARREIRELRRLADLPYAPDLPGVDAQVIAGSPGNFESTIAVDKGSDAGIQTGMPVVTGDGLVGRVVQASRKRATVLLLTDPGSGVAVRLENSGGTGVASGRAGSDLLRLDFVKPEFKVKPGELVFTAASSRYPADIPVGRVVSVKRAPGAIEQTILLQPLADIGRASAVKVLKTTPGGQGG